MAAARPPLHQQLSRSQRSCVNSPPNCCANSKPNRLANCELDQPTPNFKRSRHAAVGPCATAAGHRQLPDGCRGPRDSQDLASQMVVSRDRMPLPCRHSFQLPGATFTAAIAPVAKSRSHRRQGTVVLVPLHFSAKAFVVHSMLTGHSHLSSKVPTGWDSSRQRQFLKR